MTTGPSGALKINPQFEKDNAPAEQVTMKVTGLDAATQKPVQDMRFQVTIDRQASGRFMAFLALTNMARL